MFRHWPLYTRCILAAAMSLVWGAGVSLAQRPALAIEASVTRGDGNGGAYAPRDHGGISVALSTRSDGVSALRFFVEVAGEILELRRDVSTACHTSGGGDICLQAYPAFSGGALTVGVLTSLASRLEVRAGVGGGLYSSDRGPGGAFVSRLDLAAFVTSHIGIVAGTRELVFQSFHYDRLSSVLCSLGLRLR